MNASPQRTTTIVVRGFDHMARIRLPGGELEYAILAALWDLGRASAREVHARAGEPAGLAYTTTADGSSWKARGCGQGSGFTRLE
jgi:hypothetical protein